MDLDGRVALVTGAGRNIGRQICLTLAERGCDVVIGVGSKQEEGDAVAKAVEAMGRRALVVVADIARSEGARLLVETGIERLGSVDVLVNNAAIRPYARITDVSDADWRRVFAVNLDGPFYCCRAAVPAMIARRRGCIINISGAAAYLASPYGAHIIASKAGLHGLTRALAVELSEFGIRVNTVVVGGAQRVDHRGAEVSLEIPNYPRRSPLPSPILGRRGTVHDIANACAFLASEGASFITGQAIHVNGGSLLT